MGHFSNLEVEWSLYMEDNIPEDYSEFSFIHFSGCPFSIPFINSVATTSISIDQHLSASLVNISFNKHDNVSNSASLNFYNKNK